MERELKLVLDSTGYLRLASSLSGYAGQTWLANHYFDSAHRALRAKGAMLRIRETEAGRMAGLKQAISVRGGAFEAAEWELPLADHDWRRVVRAGGDLGVLQQPVIREAFALAQAPVLPYLGVLRVLRKTYRLSAETSLELDLACFGDGSQDWELEVESERPEAIRPFVEELLERRRIAWQDQTRTKYERFLAGCGAAPPPPLCESANGEVETVAGGLRVRRAGLPGPAVFAGRDFAPGEPVLEIEGAAAGGRPRPPGRRWIQIGRQRYLDATGTASAVVRHSCLPTTGVRGARTLVALRRIAAGDEITYDYAMTEERLDLVCLCGTAACRARVGGYRSLPERLRRAYRGRVSEYLLDAEDTTELALSTAP